MNDVLTAEERRALLLEQERELIELDDRATFNRLQYYQPYPKQIEFHNGGKANHFRMFFAGNQLGKTTAGGSELAMHLTGRYPDDWDGYRFDKPVRCWVAGPGNTLTRDGPQKILLGERSEGNIAPGTGTVPRDSIGVVTAARGVPNMADTVEVKHESGGWSVVIFKSYEMGAEKFQADTIHIIWLDEEPPDDIFSECKARLIATNGILFITATPNKGMTNVVREFYPEPKPNHHMTRMELDDIPGLTPERKAEIIASFPEHERDARTRGLPMLGSGRVFPVAEELIKVEPFVIPEAWPRIGALDFGGFDHPQAAAWMAHDTDRDIVYLYDEYRQHKKTIPEHAVVIRARCPWIPFAWPHDGLQHDRGSGEAYADQYRNAGLNMLPERAHVEIEQRDEKGRPYIVKSAPLEASIADMLARMETGRFKVFSSCGMWFEEFRTYHRKDGVIVKLYDDLISASRYGIMMLRHATKNKPMKWESMQNIIERCARREGISYDQMVARISGNII